MKITILSWQVTVGLSFVSLLFNYGYFWWLEKDPILALKFSASSLITLGCSHLAHQTYLSQNK